MKNYRVNTQMLFRDGSTKAKPFFALAPSALAARAMIGRSALRSAQIFEPDVFKVVVVSAEVIA
jgi:hypothetical protein